MNLNEVNHFIEFVDNIIGKPGPISFDTEILSHNDDEDYGSDINIETMTIGKKGKKITFKDISKVFAKIKKNKLFNEAFDSGRSYFFEGVKEDDGWWVIQWGS